MSVVSLADAKAFLDVIHGADDNKLQTLLDGAEDEAMQYMGRSCLTDWDDLAHTIPPSVVVGIMLLLQASYQATPDDAEKLRRAAEVKLTPYRIGWGV